MNLNSETQIVASVAAETSISGTIATEAQIIGVMPVAVMILDDWVLSMVPIAGGNRLIARKGSQIQSMDIYTFSGVTDDGAGNVIFE